MSIKIDESTSIYSYIKDRIDKKREDNIPNCPYIGVDRAKKNTKSFGGINIKCNKDLKVEIIGRYQNIVSIGGTERNIFISTLELDIETTDCRGFDRYYGTFDMLLRQRNSNKGVGVDNIILLNEWEKCEKEFIKKTPSYTPDWYNYALRYLILLPNDIRDKAIINFYKAYNGFKDDIDLSGYFGIEEIIYSAFSWEDTIEGGEYRRDVSEMKWDKYLPKENEVSLKEEGIDRDINILEVSACLPYHKEEAYLSRNEAIVEFNEMYDNCRSNSGHSPIWAIEKWTDYVNKFKEENPWCEFNAEKEIYRYLYLLPLAVYKKTLNYFQQTLLLGRYDLTSSRINNIKDAIGGAFIGDDTNNSDQYWESLGEAMMGYNSGWKRNDK